MSEERRAALTWQLDILIFNQDPIPDLAQLGSVKVRNRHAKFRQTPQFVSVDTFGI